MFDFINAAEGIEKVYLFFGIFGSTIFIILNILFALGLLDEIDFDSDFNVNIDFEAADGSFTPYKIFTFRGLIAFFMFFGWAGYISKNIFWAIFFGFIAFVSIGLLYYFSRKLQDSGNFTMNDLIGRKAKVYLKIKGDMESQGKILIQINTGIKEMIAISEETLEYNDKVVVVDIKDNYLVVKKIEEE